MSADEEWQSPVPLDGEAATPPDPDLPPGGPVVIFQTQGNKRTPTLSEFCNTLAVVLIVNFIGLAIAAWVGKICWNSQTWLVGLPDIAWGTAFTAAVLLRLIAMIIRL